MEKIIARIKEERDNSKEPYIAEIGNIVIRHIMDCPEDAERVTADKTLAGCFDFLKERARKNQKNGCGVCGDADVYDYFEFAGRIIPSREAVTVATAKQQALADFNAADLFD